MLMDEEVRAIVKNIETETMAGLIDHTLLSPTATRDDIDKFVSEGVSWGMNLCVNESRLEDALRSMEERGPAPGTRLAGVIGFPLGAATPGIKGFSAKHVLGLGAHEVDMVINVGYLKDGDERFREDLEAVAYAINDVDGGDTIHVLKVIIETCYLNREEKVDATRAIAETSEKYGLRMMVKTSTGLAAPPEGVPKGAVPEDIALIRETLDKMGDKQVGIKASGGVRDISSALEMMKAAGCLDQDLDLLYPEEELPFMFRLGTSSGCKIMTQFEEMVDLNE